AAWLAVEPSGPTWTSVCELVEPASTSRPASCTPSTSATFIAVIPLSGTKVARPSPRTTVFGRVTFRVWFRWYTPGVTSRFLPAAKAAFMSAAVAPGLATKNWLNGIDVPGVPPLVQLAPDELVCTPGTNTWYAPALSM